MEIQMEEAKSLINLSSSPLETLSPGCVYGAWGFLLFVKGLDSRVTHLMRTAIITRYLIMKLFSELHILNLVNGWSLDRAGVHNKLVWSVTHAGPYRANRGLL